MGAGESVASRDGQGVHFYPTRYDGLAAVMRPATFHLSDAMRAIIPLLGAKYGWWDLLNFMGLHINTKGIVCSSFATLVLRAAGVPVFDGLDANRVAPCHFLHSPLLTKVTWC